MPHRSGLAAIALALFAYAADGPAILRPQQGAVVAPGTLSIVVKAAKPALTVDGKPVAATQAGPGAWTADIQLSAGLHTIALADGAAASTIEFTAAAAASFRAHPPAATACSLCHAVKGDVWAFRTEPLGDACFGCHDAKRFAPAHEHNAEVLFECGLCHNPHGSSAAKHLKMKKELACKQCHG